MSVKKNEDVLEKQAEEGVSRPNKLSIWFQENKSLLIKVFVFTAIFSLLGHAYAYFNMSIANDKLAEYRNDTFYFFHKVSLGRFLQPVVRYLLGEIIVLQWIEGCFFILITTCSVFLICKTFNYQKLLPIIIVSGVFTNNLWVIITTSIYTHDLSSYALALFLSILAFSYYIKNKNKLNIFNIFIIILIVICSNALYQAFFAVTITLVLIDSIISLLKENNFKSEFKKLAIIMSVLLVAVVLYYLNAVSIAHFIGTSLTSVDYAPLKELELPLNMIQRIPDGYSNIVDGLFFSVSIFPKSAFYGISVFINIINCLLLVLSVWLAIKTIIEYKIKWYNIIFILILFLLLPLAASSVYILGGVWRVLYYSYSLFYIFVLEMFKFSNKNIKFWNFNKFAKILSFGMLFIISSNIQLANVCYQKYDLEKQTILSVMTRIIDKIESTPNYFLKKEVVFVGELVRNEYFYQYLTYDDFSQIDLVRGIHSMGGNIALWTLEPYISYVLKDSITNCFTTNKYNYFPIEQIPSVLEMPQFPYEGYVKEIGDKIVVKLSEI